MMERLADDVAYLHGLRRVVPPLAHDEQGMGAGLAMADTLLPAGRGSPAARRQCRQHPDNLLSSTHAQN